MVDAGNDGPRPTVADRYGAADVERFYAEGHWNTDTLTTLVDRAAAAAPDRTFVTDATTALTFGELQERSRRLAAGLVQAGIGAGDRVVVQLPNWTDIVSVVAAVARVGAIVVPIMPIYRANEVDYVLGHSRARLVITCAEFGGFRYGDMYASLRAAHPAVVDVFLARDGGDGGVDARPLDELAVTGDPAEIDARLPAPPSADDGHIIVYTSGTTARPKGCFHTWNTMAFTARTMARNLGYSADDVAFGPSPITHATGYMTSVVIPLLTRAGSHVMEAWNPTEALERIARHGCTTAVTATAFLQMLLDAYDPGTHDASTLRLWVCAGSPIPPSVFERAAKTLPSCEFLSLYGRSENFVTTMCPTGDDPQLSLTSDGRPAEGIEVAIVDEAGDEVPTGAEGDIGYRGPGHMLGYFRNPEETAAMFTPAGFSRSGDLGFANDAGYVRVSGRLKDIIIRGGLNISATEIEDHLLSHPDVSAAAVVAMPDERLGERACAYLVPASGSALTLESIGAHLRSHGVANQKLPERVELVEQLPMTATGKVQKHLLRADVVAKLADDERRKADGVSKGAIDE